MRIFAPLRSVISALFHRSLVENELEEELRAHIQDRANDLERSGVPRAEAERSARIEFGGYQKFREECREAQGTHFFESLIQDLRFGQRMLRKSPGFTAVAVLTLALGIGANTAIFSFVNAVLLKSLPVKQAEQLMTVGSIVPSQPGPPYSSFSYPVFREMREKDMVFSGVFARSGRPMSLSGSGQTERVQTELVSGNFYSVLGVNPHLGSLFTEADDQTPGAHPVAVISYDFWQR